LYKVHSGNLSRSHRLWEKKLATFQRVKWSASNLHPVRLIYRFHKSYNLYLGPVSDSNRYFDLTDIPAELAGISIAGSVGGSDKNAKGEVEEGRRGKRVKRSLDEMDGL
jgi:hypothetical protein